MAVTKQPEHRDVLCPHCGHELSMFEEPEPQQGERLATAVAGAVDEATPTVVSIHIALATRLPMRSVDSVEADAGAGLVGDRYHGTRHRHVTIQSADGLAEASIELGREIDPGTTRRNLTISHGIVPSKPGDRLRVGTVDLEVVRIAAPCKLLDDVVGDGARVALRRRAGSVCRVLSSGLITVGDEVDLLVASGASPAPAGPHTR